MPAPEWVFRLTVTDDDGAQHTVLVMVPIEEVVVAPVLPWLGVGAVRPWVGAGVDTWRGVARV